jgi:3,4-dihydroxy 2-butanone 4-phosphate synthase/GTP cyclohydrolase II
VSITSSAVHDSVDAAVDDVRAGKFVILVDDEDRENEGDLFVAAEKVTPAHIAFMAKRAGGLICAPMESARLDHLKIPPMVGANTSRYGTAFSVSVEARDLVTTGISAHDRCATVHHLIDPNAKASDFAKPGHTFPLRAAEGGVLSRAGQTEAAVDLARLAGLYPAGVICEILNDDGTMARMPQLTSFAAANGLRILAIRDLIAYRRRTEHLIARVASSTIALLGREWTAHVYEETLTRQAHLALVLGQVEPAEPVLVRMHSCCLTGDAFGSLRCECGEQLVRAVELIVQDGRGAIVYLSTHEGRGIGLVEKLRAYALQDQGLDTVEANAALDQPSDSREYGIGYQILSDLGARRLRLLTNNPRKLIGLEDFGLTLLEQVPLVILANPHNEAYLRTKSQKMGHLL